MAAPTGPTMVPDLYMGFYTSRSWIAKTTAYQILVSDNGTIFTNKGATGSVTFTLPAIAPFYRFRFYVIANQTIIVASKEGSNMVTPNNAAANQVAFSTGGAKIGAWLDVYTPDSGTGSLWLTNINGTSTVS